MMINKKVKRSNWIMQFVCIACLLLFSCKKEMSKFYPKGGLYKKYTTDYNGNVCGDYFEYYKNGKLKLKHIYSNGILIDSSVCYYMNGEISEIYFHKDTVDYCVGYKNYKLKKISHEGFLFKADSLYRNGRKIGKWKYYDDNKVTNIVEYLNVCGTEYTNQGWFYDKHSRITKKGSNYYTLKMIKRKYKIGEKIDVEIIYTPIIDQKSKAVLYMSPEIDNEFCNIDLIKLDTVFSQNNKFRFSLGFKKKGKKFLRGYINELFLDTKHKQTDVRTVFFSIPLTII